MAFLSSKAVQEVQVTSLNQATVKLEIKCVPNLYVRAVRRTRVVALKSNERSELALGRGIFTIVYKIIAFSSFC